MTPKAGRICYGPSYWLVTAADEVLFYKGHSPQCNVSFEVARYLLTTLNLVAQGAQRIQYVEMAYLSHRCET
jgi:hypothetical protein